MDWSRNAFGFRNRSGWLPAIAKRRCKNFDLPKREARMRDCGVRSGRFQTAGASPSGFPLITFAPTACFSMQLHPE